MSYHQVEDIIEDAINLLDRADILANEKRDLIYNLYRFHDRFDTSFTRFRVLSVLKDCHYAYQLPIEEHSDYQNHKAFFEAYDIDTGDWIPVDIIQQNSSVYVQYRTLFFEAGDDFWKKIKEQLPKVEQKLPKHIPLPLVFYTLLMFAEQQNEYIFIKRWYATFVNSVLEYDIDHNDNIPKLFSLWLKDDTLMKIRNFAQTHHKAIKLKDKIYNNDELLALPNLKEEEQFARQVEKLAKLRFLLDLKSSLHTIEEKYRKENSPQLDFSKYDFIYNFFRVKLGNEWQDGIRETAKEDGLITFLTKIREKKRTNEADYACIIIEYSTERKTINFRIGIQNGMILKWQNRAASPKPELQHFTELLLVFIPEKELEKNKHISNWGGWKYDIKQSKNTLIKRLENLWMCYETYNPKIYKFYTSSVFDCAGIKDKELRKKRKKALNKGYSFFANEIDFKLFVACLNFKSGNMDFSNQYVSEIQDFLDKGLGSVHLKGRIKQGVFYIKTNEGVYPEITTIYSGRLQK